MKLSCVLNNSMACRCRSFRLIGLVGCLGWGFGLRAQLTSDQKADVGFTSMQTRLGLGMPTGQGVSASQVEADYLVAGSYRTDTSVFTDKAIIFPLATGTTSAHARIVGRYFYGSSSLSPDVGASADAQEIISYRADHWLNAGFLGTGTGFIGTETSDIQNHSWVFDGFTEAAHEEILRRIDYSIRIDDYVATFGLDNGSVTTVPALMASAYNGITVGLSNGNHSRGGTLVDGSGRTRPDIVVPTTLTSWATPTVGSAAALLIETARTTGGLADGERSEVIKSLLMTGATRDEAEFGGTWSNSSSQPLDEVYGAGELNIDRSHALLTGGEYASGASVAGDLGWSFESISSADGPKLYFVDLVDPGGLDVSMTWNRLVDNTLTPSLSNLDLRVYEASGFSLGSLVAESISTLDNVELLALSGLSAGRYAFEVVSSDATAVDYGLSWMVVIPEVSSFWLALVVLGAWGGIAMKSRIRTR